MADIPIADLARVIGAEVDQTIRAVKIELFNGVIRDTRVKTGRLRGNWQTTNNTPASGEVEREDTTPQGADGGSAQREAAFTVKSDTVDWLSNNLPYAGVWEERDGMIARNVARIERIIKEQVRDA
jgi:hypothetical protein